MAWNDYKYHYLCFSCRRAFKALPYLDVAPGSWPTHQHWRAVKCVTCGGLAHSVGRKFTTPARRDARAWRNLELLVRAGWRGYGWPTFPAMTRRDIEAVIASQSKLTEQQRRAKPKKRF